MFLYYNKIFNMHLKFAPNMIKSFPSDLPSKATREQYAQGTIMVFPSLRDPYARKGYVR